jgi:outer membrane protein assembly factor BamB
MRASIVRFILIIAASMMLSACGTIKEFWGGDKEDLTPPEALVAFTEEFLPTVVWTADGGKGAADSYSDFGVWLQDELIISADYRGRIQAFNAQTGAGVWSQNVDVELASGAGGGTDELVLVGSQEGDVFALEQASGKIRWQKKLNAEVLSPPKSADGIVVVRTADGQVTGLDTSDGGVLWRYKREVPLLSLRGSGEPVIADGQVITGYANGRLVSLSLYDGSEQWEKRVAVPRGRSELERLVDIDATPVVRDGRVYVVAHNGRVASLSLYDGAAIWGKEMSSRTGLDAAPDEAVYVSDASDAVWALEDISGDILWQQTRLARRQITAPAILGNTVLVGDLEGYVHWISRDDGRFVSRKQISKHAIRSQPLVQGDLVYITSADGRITALRNN